VNDLAAIAGLTGNFHSRELFQQGPDAGAHQGVVVGQRDPDGFSRGVRIIGSVHIAPIRTAGCAHFSGNQAWTSEPCPGVEWYKRPPPASVARSSMLNKPRLAPRTACSRTLATSNPTPSSRTDK